MLSIGYVSYLQQVNRWGGRSGEAGGSNARGRVFSRLRVRPVLRVLRMLPVLPGLPRDIAWCRAGRARLDVSKYLRTCAPTA